MKMNKKGFTLMEMLIVIAIIAILIAIAIPTFTSALEKSRQRTDMANVRSLKSLVVADYMSEGGVLSKATNYKGGEGGTGDGKVTCFLCKGGQEFTISESDSTVVTCEAKWANKNPDSAASYTVGTKIQVIIDTKDNGKITGTIPYIPGNAS